MKRMFKKNQVIIAALAVMIAAAGYLNYSGRLFPDKAKSSEIGSEVASQELLDISQEDTSECILGYLRVRTGITEAQTSTPGEAVLTRRRLPTSIVSQAKMYQRTGAGYKVKSPCRQIIDNKQSDSDEQKKKAVNEMVEL